MDEKEVKQRLVNTHQALSNLLSNTKDVNELMNVLFDENFNLWLLQSALLKKFQNQLNTNMFLNDSVEEILNNCDLLECILMSGDVQDDKYDYIKECADQQRFYPHHATLNTWLLRYVVASWAQNHELDWARQSVLPEFNIPSKIGEATHSMIRYKEFNDNGISVQEGDPFYDHNPRTLAILHQYGAVCGGVSKFGVGMCQAFGVPACPIGQPGHCAFLWWKEGKWVMSNGISALHDSHTHGGIQWHWNKRCDYQLLFDKAVHCGEYILSEKLRLATKFLPHEFLRFNTLDYAITLCPWNYSAWFDFIQLCCNINGKLFTKSPPVTLLSSKAKVTASVEKNVGNLTDGTDSEWYCKEKQACIEFDLSAIHNINKIDIWWWAISWSNSYIILSSTDGKNYKQIANQDDAFESPEDYNEYSKFYFDPPISSQKIMFVLKEGQQDPWGMDVLIGIRSIDVYGSLINSGHTSNDVDTAYSIDVKEAVQTWMNSTQDILRELQVENNINDLLHGVKLISNVSEKLENIIDGTSSEWYCKQKEAFIIMDFGRLCSIKEISIQWWGISWSKHYEIHITEGENEEFTLVKTEKDASVNPQDYNEWSRLSGWENKTRKIKFVFKDGALDPWDMGVWIGIRQLVVSGDDISTDKQMDFAECLIKRIRYNFVKDFSKIGQDLIGLFKGKQILR